MKQPIGTSMSSSKDRSSVRRLASLATLLFLLLLLTACSVTTPLRLDPPPLDLTEPCDAGPRPPRGVDVTLDELLRTVRARELAAEKCRAQQDKLRAWVERAVRAHTQQGN